MARDKVTLLPPIPDDVKNRPLKFKELPVNDILKARPRQSAKQEDADIRVRPDLSGFSLPEEAPDLSPILKNGRRKVTIYSALKYTAPRFRGDTPESRKRPDACLHVQEMIKSEKWHHLRPFRQGGYSYFASDKLMWIDFSARPKEPCLPLPLFMERVLAFSHAMRDRLIESDEKRITDGFYTEDDEGVERTVTGVIRDMILPEGYPATLARSIVHQALFQSRHYFREGRFAGDPDRLKFRCRWDLFELCKDSDTGCMLLKIGAMNGKHLMLCTDMESQEGLPPLKELRMCSGLQMDWRKRHPHRAWITLRIAKTKPIIIA